jgi:group I intron endonuclease
MLICQALRKYGYENFRLEILKYCSPEKCIKLEQKYFNLFKPEYNILKIAGSSFGFKHSEETLAKMRERRQSEECRAKISASMKGIKKSEETRAKMSASKMGKSRSEETRAQISASNPNSTLQLQK